jgi:SAM-dependent methyltransferase
MIAPKQLPTEFAQWNRHVGAPHGRAARVPRAVLRHMPERVRARLRGPFSYQPNNATREYEYPWAYYAAKIERGMRVLEIGGGLSGLQFVVAKSGCSVVNIDPGMQAEGRGWPCDASSIAKLNRAFNTDIELRNVGIENASLEPESYDRAFSISVLEHLPAHTLPSAMRKVYNALKPGGLFVLTVDLFVNLAPFTTRTSNEYGANVDVRELISSAPFELLVGTPDELNGYAAFDPSRILSQLERYFIGDYPAMAQCIVLRRPSPGLATRPVPGVETRGNKAKVLERSAGTSQVNNKRSA